MLQIKSELRNRFLIFLFVLIAVPSSYAQIREDSWKLFTSTQGNCSVQLPGTPKDLTGPSPYMKDERQFQFELPTDFMLFKFGFSKVPASPKSDDAAVMKSFWDKYVANMEKTEGVQVISQSDFEVKGSFGREVVMRLAEMILVNRYLSRDYLFYIMITATYPENDKNPSIIKARRKFLESFTFSK